MSRVMDIPSMKLGEYMLKGWVLTDEQCHSSPDCPIPLMRSPDGSKHICVVHDGNEGQNAQPQRNDSPVASAASPAATHSRTNSRASTPATEPDASLDDFFPPPSEEALRRRVQSDLASSRIGERMLKGWAMLADECPNETCFGVPLVRAPRKDGLKDEKKECVICGNVYIQSKDARGFTSLQLASNPATQAQNGEPVASSSASTNKPSTHGIVNGGSSDDKKGKGRASDDKTTAASTTSPVAPVASQSTPIGPSSSDLAATVTQSLEASLRSLSARLDFLSGVDPAHLDPSKIGETASQMTAVMTALQASRTL